MGFFARAAAWTIGILAIVVAGVLIGGLFFDKDPMLTVLKDPEKPCPPKISAAPPAKDAPVDDVLGLRVGYSVDDVKKTLFCRSEKFDYQFEPIWHTPVGSNVKSRQRMVASRPEERISMGIVGNEGHEIVYSIWQEIEYSETAQTPTPDAMAGDLIKHYGTPHEDKDARTKRELWWVYDPADAPVKPPVVEGQDPFSAFTGWIAGSWDFGNCTKHAKLSPLDNASWNEKCGVTIHALIEKRPEDGMRVMRYRIVSTDQARLAAAVTAWRERKVPGTSVTAER